MCCTDFHTAALFLSVQPFSNRNVWLRVPVLCRFAAIHRYGQHVNCYAQLVPHDQQGWLLPGVTSCFLTKLIPVAASQLDFLLCLTHEQRATAQAHLHCSYLLNVLALASQIAKLLIVPFVCLVERFWLQRHFSRPVIASILVVVAGVGIV